MNSRKKVLIVALCGLDNAYTSAPETLKSYIINEAKIDCKIDIARNAEISDYTPQRIKEYDIIGFSVPYHSDENLRLYEVTLALAESAKNINKNAKIVFGGNYATNVARNIIKNRYFVDYVVRFTGEEAFAGIINEEKPETIPNLVYRDEKGIVIETPINKRAYLSPCLVKTPVNFTVPLRNSVGCNKKSRCTFCAIASVGNGRLTPEQFAEQFRFHIETNPKLREIYIIDDNFLANYSHIRNCAQLFSKEEISENIGVCITASANDFKPEIIPALKTLKVSHIQFGFDSGDIEILKNAGKRNTPEENLRATRLAIENGFNVIASYILMWPGETKEQLLNTYRNARKIYSLSKKEPDNIIFKTGFLRVYPGSDHFEMVCKINPAYR